jgi:hypothetical protein
LIWPSSAADLLERISMQRQLLEQQLQPVGDTLHSVDRALAAVRKWTRLSRSSTRKWSRRCVAVLVVLKPSRLWRWTKRGFLAWRTWRMLRRELFALGLSPRP